MVFQCCCCFLVHFHWSLDKSHGSLPLDRQTNRQTDRREASRWVRARDYNWVKQIKEEWENKFLMFSDNLWQEDGNVWNFIRLQREMPSTTQRFTLTHSCLEFDLRIVRSNVIFVWFGLIFHAIVGTGAGAAAAAAVSDAVDAATAAITLSTLLVATKRWR